MKRKQKKTETGYIVRSTSFVSLRRKSPKHGTVTQKKTGPRSYELTSYRGRKKILTTIHIVKTQDEAESVFRKSYSRFEKRKDLSDIGGSIQRFDGTIRTVRQGKVWIKGGVTKSSHLYSIPKKGTKKKNRAAEYNNRLLSTLETLDTYDYQHYKGKR